MNTATVISTAALASITLAPRFASADIVTYSGPLSSTRAQFNIDSDDLALTENFDSFGPSAIVGDMPNNPARFAEEYADGSPAPLPIIQAFAGAPSGARWIANFGNGRPAASAWVIRPDDPSDLIYAFGQVNAQGDWVRIEGFNPDDELVVTVDAQPIVAGCFAGFIVREGCAKVVVTPLGNGDFLNGMDDVQVSTTPIDLCDVDINCDGELDFLDISAFLSAYNNQQPVADLNNDTQYDFLDISLFIAHYTVGCP